MRIRKLFRGPALPTRRQDDVSLRPGEYCVPRPGYEPALNYK